jgi:hypothetical protein
MSQPTFVQKIDGSSVSAHSLTLTPGSATTAGDMLLVGVVMNPNGVESPQTVAGIKDSAGDIFAMSADTGVPYNTWSFLGGNNCLGVRTEWWVCKGAVSITDLVISITGTGATGLQSIIAVMLEYSGANGVSFPNFQSLQTNQNTITTQHIQETAAVYPNSGAALMIGLFAMLSDSFSTTPPTPPSAPQVVRSTNSLSIPPNLSYQVIEQGTESPVRLYNPGGEQIILAADALNITAESASQLATAANVAASSMQCLYLQISGGLILNTPPGFSDLPDASLAAGRLALGSQMAKINGNAALGMCRMEFFQGLYSNGQTVELPISPVDGYQYQINELAFVWAVYSTANPSTGWVSWTGNGGGLWYCGWGVDQETGLVSCVEWYCNDYASAQSNDGTLQVFTIAQRQQETLQTAETPSWTQLQASTFVTDLAYSTDVLTAMNDDAKFSVIGQEAILMGPFYDGQTVPRPYSPADGYEYAYSEITFLFSWMFTTQNTSPEMTPLPWVYMGGKNLGSLEASINPSTGLVTCAVGMSNLASVGGWAGLFTTLGYIQVVALCQRARTGSVTGVANKFAEISNALFYPGNVLPAGLGAQIVNNIQEAALTPEYFGPTLYALGSTIPLPVSPHDGYEYQRSELTYLWEWGEMSFDPWPESGADFAREALFTAQINQSTGVITNTVTTVGGNDVFTSVVWRNAHGGAYVANTTNAQIMVTVVACRSAQQTEITQEQGTPPSDVTTYTPGADYGGVITFYGV